MLIARLLRFEIFSKYDEYFVPDSAPLLHRRIFATGSVTAYKSKTYVSCERLT